MISQSDKLRMRHERDGGGKSLNNPEAKTHDVKIQDVMKKILDHCKIHYPDKTWSLHKSFQQTEIAKKINSGYIPEYKLSGIRPDGGILYMNEHPVLVTEAKKQGTNNLRQQEGKKKQAKGNAIERAHKNYNELKNLFDNYSYFPYLIFAYGCDFEKGCSIIDRCAAMTYYDSYNTLHIHDEIINKELFNSVRVTERHKKASVFIQEESYTEEFIFQKSLETIHIVMNLL